MTLSLLSIHHCASTTTKFCLPGVDTAVSDNGWGKAEGKELAIINRHTLAHTQQHRQAGRNDSLNWSVSVGRRQAQALGRRRLLRLLILSHLCRLHSGFKSITIIIYYMFEIIEYNRILNIVQILNNLRIKSKILSEVRTKIDMLEKNVPLRW